MAQISTHRRRQHNVNMNRCSGNGKCFICKLLIGAARPLVTAGLSWALLSRVYLRHAKALFAHLSLPLLAAAAPASAATLFARDVATGSASAASNSTARAMSRATSRISR
jgi:hypothetical protein